MTATAGAEPRQAVLLDAAKIRQRRIELRMTESQLGRLVGKRGQLVRRIEAGLSHEGVTLRVLNRLAEALALPLPALLLESGPGGEPESACSNESREMGTRSDVATVGALLASIADPVTLEGIAKALTIPAGRVDSALAALDAELRPRGMKVERSGRGCAVVPLDIPLDSVDAHSSRRQRAASRPLGVQEARMLLRVLRGDIVAGPALDRPIGMILGKLAAAGVVELPIGRWASASPPRPTQRVLESLMLDVASAGSARTPLPAAAALNGE